MLTHFSLFSGIGGIDLAAEWAGFQSVGFCEIDPYCQKVLAKHWPGVPIYPDIKELKGEEILERVKDRKYDYAVSLYESGLSIQYAADYYGITRQAMWKILQRRNVTLRPQQRNGEDNHFYRGGETANDHAQNMLEYALRKGMVERKKECEACGDSGTFKDGRNKVQGHHSDYNKPLEVIWLCQRCHHEWHKNNVAIEKVVMPNESQPERPTLLSGGFP